MKCKIFAILFYLASFLCFDRADATTENAELLNVCDPNPCGEHGKCTVVLGKPACTCDESQDTPEFRCTPECSRNDDCHSDKACINYSCKDPCTGYCGTNMCVVEDHVPYCNPKVVSICVTNPIACQ